MKINSSAVAPRILGSRGTPSKFVLYVLKDMYAKFGAFTRFVTIFVNFDANGLDCRSVQNADFRRLGDMPRYVVCNTNSPDDMFMFAFELFSSKQQYKYSRAG